MDVFAHITYWLFSIWERGVILSYQEITPRVLIARCKMNPTHSWGVILWCIKIDSYTKYNTISSILYVQIRYTIIWAPKQLSLNAINMMQYIVDSPLNLQLDNYYLILIKGRSRIGRHSTIQRNDSGSVYLTLKNDYYTPRNTFSSIVKRGILW